MTSRVTSTSPIPPPAWISCQARTAQPCGTSSETISKAPPVAPGTWAGEYADHPDHAHHGQDAAVDDAALPRILEQGGDKQAKAGRQDDHARRYQDHRQRLPPTRP